MDMTDLSAWELRCSELKSRRKRRDGSPSTQGTKSRI